MKRRIGFLTSALDPQLTTDDRLVLEPLRALDIEVVPLIWDRDGLEEVEISVFRSCWDYHLKADAFRKWLDSASPVLNPVDVVKRNLSKRYLVELFEKGVRVPRSVWIPAGGELPVVGGPTVLKPAVSLNGFNTFLVLDPGAMKPLVSTGDFVLQEFIPEIRTAGEISFVFFGGEFSHAIRKLPRAGEFRVQVEHGGKREVLRPDTKLVDEARELLRAGGGDDLLYARVDAVETPRGLVLMELELIDPMLFLAYDSLAPARFARAIADRCA